MLVLVRARVTVLRRPSTLSELWLEREAGAVRLVERAYEGALEQPFARLARFDPASAEDRAALHTIWTETHPAPDGWPRTPARPAPAPPRAPQPSAAHPRAYRGTTYQPPKRARVRLDVRPLLDRWFALRALGVEGEDPYARVHHGAPPGASLDALPPTFRALVMPLVRGTPWRSVRELAGVIASLDVPPAPVAALARAAPTALVDWLRGALVLTPTARASWLDRLSERDDVAGIDAVDASGSLARVLALAHGEQALDQRDEHGFDELAARYLAFLRAGSSGAFAAGTLELRAEHPGAMRTLEPVAGREDVAPLVRRVLDALAPMEPTQYRYVQWCWRVASRSPRSAALLDTMLERGMTREALRPWLHVVTWCWRDEPAWTELLASVLARVAPDDVAFPQHLSQLMCDPKPDELPRARRALALAERLGARSSMAARVLDDCDLVSPDDLGPRALDALALASRSGPDRARLSVGLRALFRAAPELARRLLATQPRLVFRVARHLGLMREDRAVSVVRGALTDPCFEPPTRLTGWTALATVRFRRDPLSRALREHLAGRRALTDAQRARHLERAHARWDLVRTGIIEERAQRELARAVPGARAASDAMEHALGLLASIGTNRRGLRRLIHARARGDLDVVERHPASRAWLVKHPRIDPRCWRAGVVIERDGLRLAVEQDPLEVLRLGTYVGSCLGLSDILEDHAAGVALDVNKRVVYARDTAGRVVARQLVAISESDELVCFSVYPLGVAEPVAALFRAYDDALAAHLGVELARTGYQVADILSTRAWDDGLWDAIAAPYEEDEEDEEHEEDDERLEIG